MKLNLAAKIFLTMSAVFIVSALAVAWLFFAGVSGSEAPPGAEMSGLRLACLVVIGIGFVISAVALGLVARSFSRRIGFLIRTTDAITSGRRNVVVPVFSGGDEASVLSKSLNAMCVKLERSLRELEELNNSLEERVDKRSADLRRLNEKLSAYVREAEVQAQCVKQANIYKTQFLANMSHDIRTPLNGILGMADIVRKTDLTREQKECIDDIVSSGELLAAIINDILDLSRIEAGRLNLEKRAFDMKKVIEDVRRLVASQAEQKNLFFYHDYPEDVPRYAAGDAVRISQILMNLLSNAVKFTDVGGIKLEVSGKPVKDGVCVFAFKVQDTGIGIPADRQGCLFEKFVQLDDSITRRRNGVGLGLSICKKLAEIMNGSIRVDSKYGRGSTFTVEIPLPVVDRDEVSVVAEDTGKVTLNWRRKPRILVAEDSVINQKIVCKFVENVGCECALANDGFEAIEIFKNSDFDLVFMDIQMPNLDGIAAIKEMRKMEQKRNGLSTPLIALTAHVMPMEQKACIEAGADGFLFKPLAEKDLKITLKRYLRSLLVGEEDAGGTPLPDASDNTCAAPVEENAQTGTTGYSSTPTTAAPTEAKSEAESKPVAASGVAPPDDLIQDNVGRNESATGSGPASTRPGKHYSKDEILQKTLPLSSPILDIDLSETTIFNRQKAISNFAGNRELLDEMVAYFADNLDRHVNKLETALRKGDFKTVDSVSHLIKGEAATLCINRIQLVAGQLEQTSRNRNLDLAKQMVENLKTQIGEFREELGKISRS